MTIDCSKHDKEIYNKAIDDFVNDCKKDILCQTYGLDINRIKYKAEKLKRRNRFMST